MEPNGKQEHPKGAQAEGKNRFALISMPMLNLFQSMKQRSEPRCGLLGWSMLEQFVVLPHCSPVSTSLLSCFTHESPTSLKRVVNTLAAVWLPSGKRRSPILSGLDKRCLFFATGQSGIRWSFACERQARRLRPPQFLYCPACKARFYLSSGCQTSGPLPEFFLGS